MTKVEQATVELLLFIQAFSLYPPVRAQAEENFPLTYSILVCIRKQTALVPLSANFLLAFTTPEPIGPSPLILLVYSILTFISTFINTTLEVIKIQCVQDIRSLKLFLK